MVRARHAALLLLVALAAAACARGERGRSGAAPDAGPAAPPARPAANWEEATETAGANWPVEARREAVTAGAEVLTRHQCVRCHEIDGLAGTGRPYDCVSCHVFLKGLLPSDRRYQQIAANNGRDVLERYQRNISHLLAVPSLTGVARRVRPDWIASYLGAPYDVRPALEESMIRNRLDPVEIRAVVRYFAAVADEPDPYADAWSPPALPPRPDVVRLVRGRVKFVAWGCPTCHTFANERFLAAASAATYTMQPQALLAPNLRFARERLRRDVLIAFVLDPSQVSPGSPMPRFGVPPADAELIADYLLFAPFSLDPPAPPEPLLEMPPAAAAEVTWEQVKERVLGKVCVHCHMNDHEKDIGAGNGGGLGYAGKGLSFRTYEMTMRGAVGADGRRYSVFVPLPGERWPRVLQVLLDRRLENRRDFLAPLDDRERPPLGDHLVGMPLGLPALTDEEIGLLRRWIELGCPGPTQVTGKPGFTDGFLVPDGPVAQNHGCDVRAPEEPPPAWATRAPAPR